LQFAPWRTALKGVAVASLIGLASVSFAGLGPIDQATEMMMEYQGSLLHTLASYIGPQSKTQLAFTSFVDPNGQYFTFTLGHGQQYNGIDMTFSGEGLLTAPDTWSLASLASAGAGIWTSSGEAQFMGDPEEHGTFDSFFDVFFGLTLSTTTISDVTYEQTAIRTASLGKITVSDGMISKSYKGHDVYNTQTGEWTWFQGDPYPDNSPVRTSSTGSSPGGGEEGQFVTYVDPVPGPSAALAPVIGFAYGFLRSRHKRR